MEQQDTRPGGAPGDGSSVDRSPVGGARRDSGAVSSREARAAARQERRAQRAARSPYSAVRTGPGRLLTAVYGLQAFSALGRVTYQVLVKFGEAPFAYALSALAMVVYIVATVCLVVGTRTSHHIAIAACAFEAVGVLVVGTLSFTHPDLFAHDSVWSFFGRGYGYVPLVLPFIGLWWLALVQRRISLQQSPTTA